MNRYFTTNVLRMFQNRKIYICTLGMALTLYMSGIAFIRSDGDSANLQFRPDILFHLRQPVKVCDNQYGLVLLQMQRAAIRN